MIKYNLRRLSDYVNEKEDTDKKRAAITYMLIAGFLFVMSGIFIKQIEDVSTMQIFCLRTLVSLVINSIIMMWKTRKEQVYVQDKTTFKVILQRITFGFIADYCYVAMFKYLTVSDGISIVLTYPIISAFMAGIILNETISKTIYLSLLLCLIGILFICKPPFILHLFFEQYTGVQSEDLGMGITMGMGFAFFLSLSIILTRQLSGKTSNYVIMQYLYFQTIFSSTIFIISESTFTKAYLTQNNFIMLIGTGTSHYFAQILNGKSLFLEKASLVVPFSYAQIIYTFLSDIFIFGYDVNMYSVIGCILIISGSYLTTRAH